MKKQVVNNKKINGSLEVHSSQYESTAIPSSWKIARFDDVATVTDYVANGSFASLKENVKYREEPSYAILVRFTDYVKNWKRNFVYVNKDAYDFLAKSSLQLGDVVIANVGEPGRVFRVPNLGRPMTLGPNAVLVKGRNGVEKGFLFYFFMSPWGQNLIASITTGTAQKKFNKTGLRATYIPIAPHDDQKRIVAEIEKQFSRLDEAVANLKRVKANLKRYKAAVLKAAVEGRLVETEAELARREGRRYETGTQLLQRMLEARRSQWKGEDKYKEPFAPDKIDLTELPEGWVWVTVSQLLGEPLVNGLSVKESIFPTEVRALRLSAMSDQGFDYTDHRFLPTKPDQVADIIIREGDVFVSRGNGSLHLVGRSTEAQPPPFDVIFPDTMMRLRLAEPIRMTGWFQAIWTGETVRRQIERRVKTTAGIYKIAQPQLANITIPLPPLAEQARVVAEIDRRLSLVREVTAQVDDNLARAERLRQTILKEAYLGKLM